LSIIFICEDVGFNVESCFLLLKFGSTRTDYDCILDEEIYRVDSLFLGVNVLNLLSYNYAKQNA